LAGVFDTAAERAALAAQMRFHSTSAKGGGVDVVDPRVGGGRVLKEGGGGGGGEGDHSCCGQTHTHTNTHTHARGAAHVEAAREQTHEAVQVGFRRIHMYIYIYMYVYTYIYIHM